MNDVSLCSDMTTDCLSTSENRAIDFLHLLHPHLTRTMTMPIKNYSNSPLKYLIIYFFLFFSFPTDTSITVTTEF